jgi:hypothetical protein
MAKLQDDLFGQSFEVCDEEFDRKTHVHVVLIPDQVTMTLLCPLCNPATMSPLAPPLAPTPAPAKTNRCAAQQKNSAPNVVHLTFLDSPALSSI